MTASCLCDHLICLDYYDGPVRAIAKCSGKVLAVSMVDADCDMEKRAFVVHEIPDRFYEELFAWLSKHDTPRCPIWLPKDLPEGFELPGDRADDGKPEELWITDRYFTESLLTCPVPADVPEAWSWEKEAANQGEFIVKCLSCVP